jgi:hypothetical protein
VSTARLYFEAVVAIMIMLTLSVISDNRIALMVTIAVVFLAMGHNFVAGLAAVGRGQQIWVRSTCSRDTSTLGRC